MVGDLLHLEHVDEAAVGIAWVRHPADDGDGHLLDAHDPVERIHSADEAGGVAGGELEEVLADAVLVVGVSVEEHVGDVVLLPALEDGLDAVLGVEVLHLGAHAAGGGVEGHVDTGRGDRRANPPEARPRRRTCPSSRDRRRRRRRTRRSPGMPARAGWGPHRRPPPVPCLPGQGRRRPACCRSSRNLPLRPGSCSLHAPLFSNSDPTASVPLSSHRLASRQRSPALRRTDRAGRNGYGEPCRPHGRRPASRGRHPTCSGWPAPR